MAGWAAILKILGAGYSAYSSITAANEESSLLENQGLLARQDYERQARLTRDGGYRFQQKQLMEYISSGVEIQGTPLLTLAETEKKYQAEAKYLESTGERVDDLYRSKAKAARAEGLSNAISSILGGASSVSR